MHYVLYGTKSNQSFYKYFVKLVYGILINYKNSNQTCFAISL